MCEETSCSRRPSNVYGKQRSSLRSQLGGVNSLVCVRVQKQGHAAEDEEKTVVLDGRRRVEQARSLPPSPLTDVGKLVLKAEPADRKREEDSLHTQKGATMVRLDARRCENSDGFQRWRR